MNLNNGEFETIGSDGIFSIFITQNAVIRANTGKSYIKQITNEYQLDQKQARNLLNELKLYLGDA